MRLILGIAHAATSSDDTVWAAQVAACRGRTGRTGWACVSFRDPCCPHPRRGCDSEDLSVRSPRSQRRGRECRAGPVSTAASLTLQSSRASPLQLSATFPEMRGPVRYRHCVGFSVLLFPGMILAGGDRCPAGSRRSSRPRVGAGTRRSRCFFFLGLKTSAQILPDPESGAAVISLASHSPGTFAPCSPISLHSVILDK